jgi:thioredoxin 1
MLSPIIEEIANDKANYNIGKVNVDKNQNLAAKYNVMSIPTLIIFKNGKEHSRMIGVQSKEKLLSALA